MSLPPSNSQNVVSLMGLYKMGRRTSVNGTLQFTSQSQDEALIPWTTNPVITTPTVYAAFPNLASLPRSTAEAEVKGVNALLNFNSRPFRHLSFNVRYRYNDRDMRTPSFDCDRVRAVRRGSRRHEQARRTSSTSPDRPSTPPRPTA